MPSISIIIPLFNKEKFIENTLKSVASQTFSDYEIIVINDGSTDNGVKIVEAIEDKRIKIFHTENKGVSSARNFGIEKATGKHIAFLDADDFWYPAFLENMISMIAQFPNEKVFSSAIEVEIDKITFEATYSIPKNENAEIIDFFEGSFDQTAIFTSSAVFEKSVFNIVGNFDETLKSVEDIDLWIRIGLQFKIVFSWKIGVRYCEANDSLSKTDVDYYKKPDFLKYSSFEKKHKYLRKYLDLNRFSLALKAKMANQKSASERFEKLIDLKNLNWKQKLLLQLPAYFLIKIYAIKTILHKKNIRLSAFK